MMEIIGLSGILIIYQIIVMEVMDGVTSLMTRQYLKIIIGVLLIHLRLMMQFKIMKMMRLLM